MSQLKEEANQATWLIVADSQYCDLIAPKNFRELGAEVVVRYHPKTGYFPDETRPPKHSRDNEGRDAIEDWGVLGSPSSSRSFAVRRIRVEREGQKDLVLITTLLDANVYPANDILSLYFQRWDIETAFNKLSEVFSLLHVIGCNPKATFFQFTLCCLMYNILQLLRHHFGAQQQLKPRDVSMQMLHTDIVKQLTAALMFLEADDLLAHISQPATAVRRRQRIERLLKNAWDPYFKKTPNKPRKRGSPIKKPTIPGGHTSVQRLIDKNT